MRSLFESDPLMDAIGAAQERLKGVVVHTPLLPFRHGSFIKAENLQLTGSFKFRGAYNALASLTEEQRANGVVAHSSGNHGRAVARAGRMLGIKAVVVMPEGAPAVKVQGVRDDGAEIIFVGPHNEQRVVRAHEIAERDGLVLIPSANHLEVMAGQGTIGFEIAAQLLESAIEPERSDEATLNQFGSMAPIVLVPVGLGGLAAGIATALHRVFPNSSILGVEPSLAADTRDSVAAGVRTAWPAERTARTMADGLRGEMPAELPFEILRRHLAGVVTVEESEIVAAMKVAAREAHLVLEPSGAVPLAALLFHRRDLSGDGPVVVVTSGGNVDPQRYAEWLATPD